MACCASLAFQMNKLFFGTLLLGLLLPLLYWLVVMDSSGVTYMYLSLDASSRESQLRRSNCIQENICKSPNGGQRYIYKPNERQFQQMLNSSVGTSRKILHEHRVIPPLVHFTWYGGPQKYHFRFHHLLSVSSIKKFVKPERIYFWYDLIPEGDYFREMLVKIPELNLIHRKAPKRMYGRPVITAEHKAAIVRLEALLEYGGMYFDLDVIVVKPLDPLLKYDLVMGYDSTGRICSGVIMAVKWTAFLKLWHKQYKTFPKGLQYNSSEIPSALAKDHPQLIHIEEKSLHMPSPAQVDQFYEVGRVYDWKSKNYAVHLWINQHNIEHNPTDIKTWNTTVGAIFRYIYYGNSALIIGKSQRSKQISGSNKVRGMNHNLCLENNICKNNTNIEYYTYTRNETFDILLHSKINYTKYIKHNERVIPSLVHFTWYGGKSKNHFRFHHMLAVLAAHKFIKPSRIYFWIDMVPDGNYFKETRQNVPELYLVHRNTPNEIYGRPIRVSEHHTDIVRLEAVMEYGGIYLDLDAMVVKSLDPLLNYEMVMGYEHDNGLCNGVIIAVAWADFLKIWHSKYKTFIDQQWADHSVILPATLAKKYKNLVHTEERSFHRPNWMAHELVQLYKEGNLYDWKKNNYIVHLWIRSHKIEHNPEDIKTWNTTVGEIFRHIYYGNWNIIK